MSAAPRRRGESPASGTSKSSASGTTTPRAPRARPTKASAPSARRARATRGESDADSRQRVIDAAIAAILEMGFYRASSNAIAERANVSWGVIQYHFGSRENLMLAVLETGTQRLVNDLSAADITGETLTERIEEYFAVLASYYAAPDYLAFTQVLLNLSHDPTTSKQTLETMRRIDEPVNVELTRLSAKVFAGTDVGGKALRTMMFHVLRGMALSEVMLQTVPWDTRPEARMFPTQRRLLAEALTLVVEKEAARDA